MRSIYLLCLFTTFWLFGSANAAGSIHTKKASGSLNQSPLTTLSTAFSLGDTEIELTVVQPFAPAHTAVEKKEPLASVVSVQDGFSNMNSGHAYLLCVSAIIAANDYRLLFPFHHFW